MQGETAVCVAGSTGEAVWGRDTSANNEAIVLRRAALFMSNSIHVPFDEFSPLWLNRTVHQMSDSWSFLMGCIMGLFCGYFLCWMTVLCMVFADDES